MGSVNQEIVFGTLTPEFDAAKKRSQVVQWLNNMFPDFNMHLDASEEELRAQMLDGVILCAILNRKNFSSIQIQRGVFISSEQRLYNLKRFLSAMDEMGLPRFSVADLEQGSMPAVVDCLLSLRDRMVPGIGLNGRSRERWNLSEGDMLENGDLSQGNQRRSAPTSPVLGGDRKRSFSEPKFQNLFRNNIMSDPSTALLHPVGQKFHEVFQLKQGRYSDLPAAKISEMMKSNSLDNAPTQSLLSVVNGILDESIERKNGEIPHRVSCLLRKVVQEIERRISTQADHIRSQNNLIKAREEKYQSRIRVLQTLASGTSEETQIVTNQLQKIKGQMQTEKIKIEETKRCDQDIDKLVREKENSDNIISELKKELENVKKSCENQCQQLERSSDKDMLTRENESRDNIISELKQELETMKKSNENRCQQLERNSDIDRLVSEKEKSEGIISLLKQELENVKKSNEDIDRLVSEKEKSEGIISLLKQELENVKKSNEDIDGLVSEKEKSEGIISLLNQELENVKKSNENHRQQLERNSDMDRLISEKENNDNIISELKQELENVKELYENRCQQLERNSYEIKTQLEERIKETNSLLVESRKSTKDLEALSKSNIQNWNKKEHIFQNFIGCQLQSVKSMRIAYESIKQEVIRTQKGWREEMTTLGVKLKVLVDAAENYHTVLAENWKLYNEIQELKGNIRVYCRVRPFLPGQNGKSTTVDYMGENGEVLVVNPSKQGKDGRRMFRFNKAFGPASTQEEVYLDIQPLVRSVLDGYNVCIFAYGQTGSGKTYTMSGPNSPTKEEWGVNYRALDDLFNISRTRSNTFLYEIGVQMVEIYNEQVRDLLTSNASQKSLGILSSSQPGGVAVPDASMLPVKSTSDVTELMQFGQSNRAMSSTALNERSSRSHSCVTIHVRGEDLKTGSSSRGCLHLIDLAGSERVDRSEVIGDRLKEAQHINKSLSALGDVIFALAQKNSHVPYRNSKLTQVLQSSLGGHAKTLMFVQVNPDVDSYSETVSTLKFAERVSGVELGAARNTKEGKDVKDLMEQVASLKDTIARKDEEIEELQLHKELKAGSLRGINSLKHSSSFSGISSIGQRSQRLVGGRMARSTEKVASDHENGSEVSDKHSEDSSQSFCHTDSEERLSDQSDSGRSVGAETGSSTVESNFPEAGKLSKATKEKIPRVLTRTTRPLSQKSVPTPPVRPKLRDTLKSPVLKKTTTSHTATSPVRPLRR